MHITPHVALLPMQTDHGHYYPALLHDDAHLFLIDTGYPGQFSLLSDAIVQAGFRVEDIDGVVFTHQDIDHIGCAKEFLQAAPHAKTYAHTVEAPYIDGTQEPVKLAAMDPTHPFHAQFKAGFDNRRIAIDVRLEDGDALPVAGAVVKHMPGHTPGHLALHVVPDGVLIAGDALNVAEGALVGANPQHTQDMAQAEASIRALFGMPVTLVATYHTGVYRGGVEDCKL